MKITKIILSAVVVFAMATAVAYAQGADVNLPLSGTIVPDNGQLPRVETHTRCFGNGRFVRTVTLTYWLDGNLKEKSVITKIYRKNGAIRMESGWIYLYDYSGERISPILRYRRRFRYGKNNALIQKALVNRYYGANRRLTSSSNSTLTYSYNTDGSLKEEISQYSQYGADGALLAGSRSEKSYTSCENGDSYFVLSGYDKDDKLVSKTATITIAGDQPETYEVRYDVNDDGEVVFTHVYDQAGNESAGLGGEGCRQPSDIINDIHNPDAPYIDIHVDGDMTLNSNETWDLSSYTINVTGTFAVSSDTNGYDIYVEGDLYIDSDKAIDLSAYSIYVNGNLSIISKEEVILGQQPLCVTGTITIQSGSAGDSFLNNVSFLDNGSVIDWSSYNIPATGVLEISANEVLERKALENTVTQSNGMFYPQMSDKTDVFLPVPDK